MDTAIRTLPDFWHNLKVESLTIRLDDQVLWLDISVDDLLLVYVLQTFDEACYEET